MSKVTWRNRKNTKTPTKAFDVSDVRRLTAELTQTSSSGANDSSVPTLESID